MNVGQETSKRDFLAVVLVMSPSPLWGCWHVRATAAPGGKSRLGPDARRLASWIPLLLFVVFHWATSPCAITVNGRTGRIGALVGRTFPRRDHSKH